MDEIDSIWTEQGLRDEKTVRRRERLDCFPSSGLEARIDEGYLTIYRPGADRGSEEYIMAEDDGSWTNLCDVR